MQCLYCGKGVGPLRELVDSDFCSDAHRKRYHEVIKRGFCQVLDAPEPQPPAPPLEAALPIAPTIPKAPSPAPSVSAFLAEELRTTPVAESLADSQELALTPLRRPVRRERPVSAPDLAPPPPLSIFARPSSASLEARPREAADTRLSAAPPATLPVRDANMVVSRKHQPSALAWSGETLVPDASLASFAPARCLVQSPAVSLKSPVPFAPVVGSGAGMVSSAESAIDLVYPAPPPRPSRPAFALAGVLGSSVSIAAGSGGAHVEVQAAPASLALTSLFAPSWPGHFVAQAGFLPSLDQCFRTPVLDAIVSADVQTEADSWCETAGPWLPSVPLLPVQDGPIRKLEPAAFQLTHLLALQAAEGAGATAVWLQPSHSTRSNKLGLTLKLLGPIWPPDRVPQALFSLGHPVPHCPLGVGKNGCSAIRFPWADVRGLSSTWRFRTTGLETGPAATSAVPSRPSLFIMETPRVQSIPQMLLPSTGPVVPLIASSAPEIELPPAALQTGAAAQIQPPAAAAPETTRIIHLLLAQPAPGMPGALALSLKTGTCNRPALSRLVPLVVAAVPRCELAPRFRELGTHCPDPCIALLPDHEPKSAPRPAGVRLIWQRMPAYVKTLAAGLALLCVLGVAASGMKHSRAVDHHLDTIRHSIQSRGAVELADDFHSGMNDFEGSDNWTDTWSFSGDGFMRTGRLALYRPSLGLSDYQLEFFGQIERKSVGWVFRAVNSRNYYAVKLVIVQTGPRPLLSIFRYTVVDGKQEQPVEIPVRVMVHNNAPYRVQLNVEGNQFTTALEGQIVDRWSDDRFKAGGVGFFSETGERARLYWMKVSSNTDFLGRMCANLVPNDLRARR